MVLQRRDDCNNSRVQFDAPYTLRNLFNYSSHSTKCFLLSPLSSGKNDWIHSFHKCGQNLDEKRQIFLHCIVLWNTTISFFACSSPFCNFFFFFFCFKKQRVQIFILGTWLWVVFNENSLTDQLMKNLWNLFFMNFPLLFILFAIIDKYVW